MRFEKCATGIVLLFALSACDLPGPTNTELTNTGTEPATTRPGPDIAASYTDGEIQLDEVEAEIASARTPACVRARNSAGGGSVETLIPCYQELAETLAIERIVLGKLPDTDQALEELDENYIEQRDAALLNNYYQRLIEKIEISDAEIEHMLASGEKGSGTPRRFTLFNIFRRHQDLSRPEETVAFLNQLRTRIDAGETFASIAREYSDSETRLNDGLVGKMSEDTLPPRLRDLTAGLESGQVSEPLIVKGGAVLIKIEKISPALEPDLEANRASARREIMGLKLQEMVEERISGIAVPVDATLLSPDQLFSFLDGENPDLLIFDIEGLRLTVGEFRNRAGLLPTDVVADLSQEHRDELQEAYQQLKQRQLLLISLLESVDIEEKQLREQLEQPLLKERLTRLVDQQLQKDMWTSVDDNTAALQRFYSDNSHHYQTPLKFKLQIFNLPFDHDPAAQLETLERLSEQIASGTDSLSQAAARLGGEVEDLGWREYSELDHLPAKARSYLLQATPDGYSVPYQHDDALHMIWVEAQELPIQLSYEEVREQVREDYFERFERRLYQDAVKQSLNAAKFVFYADNVRELLLPPGAESKQAVQTDNP